MIIGETVWYRISEDDINQVMNIRQCANSVRTWDDVTNQWISTFNGDEIRVGELLPAEVVRLYSYADLGTADAYFPELASTTFGGKADIRVSLPGSDTLYIPKAELESENFEIIGGTHLPPTGKFTVLRPAELTTY